MIKNTSDNYGLISKAFHWSTALIILGLLSLGFYMSTLDFSAFKIELYGLHKSFGTLVLLLVFLRLIWRILNPLPKALETHQPWEKALAKLVHVLLYGALIFMPLSGWLMSSAGDFPNSFFGLFEMPDLTAKNEETFKATRTAHEILAFVIIAIIGLHMAGAFKHHFIDRDDTLRRMTWPGLGFLRGAALTVLTGGLLLLPLAFYLNGSDKTKTTPSSQESVLRDNKTAQGWAINHEKSRIEFEAVQYGQGFTGNFDRFDGEIIFDPENLTAASADISIDISSITTGSSDRDEQARSGEWFDTNQFPLARFTARSFEQTGANRYIAHGDLTIRSVTLPVDLPFSLRIEVSGEEKKTALMDGKMVLNRLDFGIGQGQWSTAEVIGNSVKIGIHVEATQITNSP